jgi:urease accessory protein
MAVAELRPSKPAGWRARLSLRLAVRPGGETVVAARSHEGPLVVQRAFHPERDGTAHVYLLHPPGGLVGGDELFTDLELSPGARALVTTPAATKLYRTLGAPAVLRQSLSVKAGAVLEWLPQEAILFGGTRAESETRIDLEPSALYLGWDIVCLGRPASGDDFASGRLDQRTHLYRGGRPLLVDRVTLDAREAARSGAWGWAGRRVYGCFVASDGSDELVRELREAVRPSQEGDLFAVTRVGGVTVCRFLGSSAEDARALLARAWAVAHRHLLSKPACPPRIWAT